MNTPVNYELAKLLKEKGFDELINYYYDSFGDVGSSNVKVNWNESEELLCSAPTIAEAVMWLYEKHGIWIVVETALGEDVKCLFSWYCTDDEQNILCSDFDYTADSKYHHKSPTEAYEAAIKYCLEKY